MNSHRDIWIRWPPTLQGHVIKGTVSQNHVTTKTSITGLYNYHHHHQSRRLRQTPHPSPQTYMSTMTNIAELCILQRGHKSQENNEQQCMIIYYRFVWMPSSPQQGHMMGTVTKMCGDHDLLCWVTGLSRPALSQLCEHHNHNPQVCEYHHQQHYKVE